MGRAMAQGRGRGEGREKSTALEWHTQCPCDSELASEKASRVPHPCGPIPRLSPFYSHNNKPNVHAS